MVKTLKKFHAILFKKGDSPRLMQGPFLQNIAKAAVSVFPAPGSEAERKEIMARPLFRPCKGPLPYRRKFLIMKKENPLCFPKAPCPPAGADDPPAIRREIRVFPACAPHVKSPQIKGCIPRRKWKCTETLKMWAIS